uniref:Secreted peptide n=1 Tax=Parascaris univalens TaxID=6257 RepID=A0A915C6W1_PARUN
MIKVIFCKLLIAHSASSAALLCRLSVLSIFILVLLRCAFFAVCTSHFSCMREFRRLFFSEFFIRLYSRIVSILSLNFRMMTMLKHASRAPLFCGACITSNTALSFSMSLFLIDLP